MHTKKIGDILREERELRRISLEELAKRTRIRREYLWALEENQFEKLPASTFVKGYITTYARVFGFDAKPLLALLRRDFKESAKGKLVPRDFIRPTLRKRTLWTPMTVGLLMAGAVFFSLLTYIGVQWYNLNRPPELEIVTPEAGAVVGPKVIVEGQAEPDSILTVNDQPVSLQPDGTFSTEVFMNREGLTTISVGAKDRQGKENLQQRSVNVKF